MPTIEDAVAGYIKLRDAKKKLAEKQREEMKPYNEKLIALEQWIQNWLQANDSLNTKTPAGTAYLSTTLSAKVTDWNALRDFLIENDLIDMMERRVSKDAVEEYLNANGELPPGVAINRETNARVRR